MLLICILIINGVLLNIPNPYASKNYLLLMGIPILLLIISLFFLFGTGLHKGVELQGGVLITVQTNTQVDTNLLTQQLSAFGPGVSVTQFSNGGLNGLQIEMGLNDRLLQLQDENSLVQGLYNNYSTARSLNPIDAKTMEDAFKLEVGKFYALLGQSVPSDSSDEVLAKDVKDSLAGEQTRIRTGITDVIYQATGSKELSFDEVGSSLSSFFFQNSRTALIISFILSGIVILIIVRGLVASAAVISGAIFDLTITAGLMVLFKIDLSLGAVAALLMLVGLSLDTDIMLTINVLKRKEGVAHDRAFKAMKIGLLMNLTSLAAFGVLALVGWYYQIPTYTSIGLIVFIGSIVDFIATWCFNAGLVLWYAERKNL